MVFVKLDIRCEVHSYEDNELIWMMMKLQTFKTFEIE